jgi:hypothetical protein
MPLAALALAAGFDGFRIGPKFLNRASLAAFPSDVGVIIKPQVIY